MDRMVVAARVGQRPFGVRLSGAPAFLVLGFALVLVLSLVLGLSSTLILRGTLLTRCTTGGGSGGRKAAIPSRHSGEITFLFAARQANTRSRSGIASEQNWKASSVQA